MKLITAVLLTSILNSAWGAKDPEIEVFTLYRSVPSDETFRVHVATFDATGTSGKGAEFYNLTNMKNCERVRQMFQAQPDWKDVRFWC
jgi:hypothetical protein